MKATTTWTRCEIDARRLPLGPKLICGGRANALGAEEEEPRTGAQRQVKLLEGAQRMPICHAALS